jgi:type III pantothenate kinase
MTAKAFLLVDAGNTSVKSALVPLPALASYTAGDVVRLANSQAKREQLCAQWSRLATAYNLHPHDVDLIWSCVGPAEVRRELREAYEAWSQRSAPASVSAQREQRLFEGRRVVRNAYEDPAQLGADRWVSAIGMAGRLDETQPGNYLIVSAGTATTIDRIHVTRNLSELSIEFCGGWILPGLALMQESLRFGTAGLDYEARIGQQRLRNVPRNSCDAIGQGIALAQAGFMTVLAAEFEVRALWLHGGAAQQWKSCLDLTEPGKALSEKVQMQPGLSLQGLACLANFLQHARG